MIRAPNSGLVVFLYDDANRERIRRAAPAILGGFGPDAAADPRLAGLAREGVLATYQLLQDDPLAIEVVVGPPLTKRELRTGRWLPPQRAPLTLPSGNLCVEGYDNLRLDPEEPADQTAGSVVRLPPGDDLISLHRFDRASGRGGRGGPGASEVVVLTRAEEAEPVVDPGPMLLELASPLEEWAGQYQIRGEVFQGLIRFEDAGRVVFLNLNPQAAEELKLRAGSVLQIHVGTPEMSFETVFHGQNLNDARSVREAVARKRMAGVWVSDWMRSDNPANDHLCCFPIDPSVEPKIEARHCDRWIPARVTVGPLILAKAPPGARHS